MSEAPKVKCADCGYLFYRNSGYGHVVEAGVAERRSGDKPHNCNSMPECSRGVDLAGEYSTGGFKAIREMLQKPRACDFFRQHVPGLLPKEHLDMDLLQQQQAFQERTIERERRWMEDQARIANQRHWQSLSVAILIPLVAALLNSC